MTHFSIHKLKPTLLFLSINLALSSLFYFLIIYSGKLGGGSGLYAAGLMWCPGIVVLITMNFYTSYYRHGKHGLFY
ncbi:hypothetical protein AEQU3_03000 [Aequorivita antarctica]|nr:hypothetical protein AEQU3_03000 [Aequorivita antarctica]